MHNTRNMGTTFLQCNLCTNAVCTDRIRIKFGRYTLNIRRGYLISLVMIQDTTAWRVLRLRMEERPPIWRVAVNKLNKQPRTANEG